MWKLPRWLGAGSGSSEFELPVDALSEGFVDSPYPVYDRLRRHCPAAELAGGGYLVTRHSDVEALLKSDAVGNAPSRFSRLSSKNRDRYIAASLASHIPPFLDAPEHVTPRKALVRSFYRAFDGFESTLIEVADNILKSVPAGVPIELISEISSPFSVRSIRKFIGATNELTEAEAKRATLAFFHLFAPLKDGAIFHDTEAVLQSTREQLASAVRNTEGEDGGTLLSELVAAKADYPDLTDAAIVDNAILVLADGVENIEAAVAQILHMILNRRIVDATQKMPGVVSEALRLETPAQIIPRVARRDFDMAGVQINKDLPVFLALGSANRDPSVFSEPGEFRLGREAQPLTFGLGRHRCIGEQLGLRMIEVLLIALLERGVRLARPDQPLRYQARFGHRWPARLDVVFD